MRNKKDLLGGLIIGVLLLLILITYASFYNYKYKDNKEVNKEEEKTSKYVLNIIKEEDSYRVNKTDLTDTLNKDKIVGTYNCKYDDCNYYDNTIFNYISLDKYLVIKENNKIFLYDFISKKIVSDMYDNFVYKLENDNYIILNNGKYGLIDKDGVLISKTLYDDIDYLNVIDSDGKVSINDKYGIINVDNGKEIIKTEYNDIKIDMDNHYSILKDNLWYVIDEEENILTTGYEYTFGFNKGYVSVKDNVISILAYDNTLLVNDTINIIDNSVYQITSNGTNINILVNGINYQYNTRRNYLKRK